MRNTIELRDNVNRTPVGSDYVVVVNGEELDEKDASADKSTFFIGEPESDSSYKSCIGIYFTDLGKATKLYPFTLSDFSNIDRRLMLVIELRSENLPIQCDIRLLVNLCEGTVINTSVDVSPDYENWKQSWSVREFGEELKRLVKANKTNTNNVGPLSRGVFTGYNLEIPKPELTTTVEAIVNLAWSVVEHDLTTAHTSLIERDVSNSIVESFNFPKEVKVVCEQYLLYFAQFLQDLGVEANTEIKHEADKVLFTVTPLDERDALDKIRQALDIYLQFPSQMSTNNLLSTEGGVEVQRLSATILHLQSQLVLANSTIENKSGTIHQLRGEVLINFRDQPTHKEPRRDELDLFKGAVTLKPLDLKVVQINLPVIFRYLEEFFSNGPK